MKFNPVQMILEDTPLDKCPACGDTKWMYARSRDASRAARGVHELQTCNVCQQVCEVCDNLGWVTLSLPVDHPNFGRMIPCPANCHAVQEITAASKKNRVRYSRLSAEYENLTFDSFAALPGELLVGKMLGYWTAVEFVNAMNRNHMVDIAKVARRFDKDCPEDVRNWVVFYGEHGRGKTGLAAAILNALIDQGETPRYIRLQDFIEAIQKRYNKKKMERENGFADEFGDDTAEEVMESFCAAPILIIDEADVPGISENKLSLVQKLIRYRHGEKLPTILTTNLNPRGFEERWDATIATIVKSRAHWIPMRGASLRADAVEFDWEAGS